MTLLEHHLFFPQSGSDKEKKLTLDIKIIQPQQSNRIIHIKPKRKSSHKICPLLNGARIGRHFGRAQFHRLTLHVHAALQLEVLDQRRVDFGPGGFERGHAMWWDGHFAVFDADGVVGRGLGGGREAGAAFLVDGVVELHFGGVFRERGCGGVKRGGGGGGVEEVFVLGVVCDGSVEGELLWRRRLEGCWGRHDVCVVCVDLKWDLTAQVSICRRSEDGNRVESGSVECLDGVQYSKVIFLCAGKRISAQSQDAFCSNRLRNRFRNRNVEL